MPTRPKRDSLTAPRRKVVATGIRDMVRRIVLDPKVLENLQKAAREDAQVAIRLMEYGWGKPGPAVEQLSVNVNLGLVHVLERMSNAELEAFVKTGKLTPAQWKALPAASVPGSGEDNPQ